MSGETSNHPAPKTESDSPAAFAASVDLLAVTERCGSCDGDGYNDKWVEDDEGHDYPISIPCSRCGGTGELRSDGNDDSEAGERVTLDG